MTFLAILACLTFLASGAFALTTIVVDGNITSPDGVYGEGQVINFTIIYDNPVTIIGNAPRIELNTSPTRYAVYSDGNETNELTFSYTIEAGDTSLDLGASGINAVDLNGGEMKNDIDNVDNTLASDFTNANIIVDALPPETVEITMPIATSPYGSGSQTVTATALDSTSGILETNLYVDGIHYGASPDLISPYSFALDTTTLIDGNHSLNVVAIDNAGNDSNSQELTIVIDNGAVTYGAIDNVDVWLGSDFNVTINDANFGWSGIDFAASYYTLDGTMNLFTKDNFLLTSDYTYQINILITNDGNHLLDVRISDRSGNMTDVNGLRAKKDSGVPVLTQVSFSVGPGTANWDLSASENVICKQSSMPGFITDSNLTFATNTATATSLGTSQSFSLSGLSSSMPYTLFVQCMDENGSETEKHIQFTSYTTNTSSGSSRSSGGSYSGLQNWVTLPSSDVNESNEEISVELGVYRRINFDFNGQDHTVGLKSTTSDSATVVVESSPQTETINAGESKEFDLDGDGTNDMLVKIESVTTGKANVKISFISKNVPLEPSTSQTNTNIIEPVPTQNESMGTNQAPVLEQSPATADFILPASEETDKTPVFAIIALIVVVAVVAGYIILGNKPQ